MPTFDDVRRLALALPDTEEKTSGGNASWRVRDKGFVWERPLRRGDLEALGADAPKGPILGVRTEHVGAKAAMIGEDPAVFFTTPHFDGYPAVLVRLDAIELDELAAVIEEAWVTRAPKRLAAQYLEARGHPAD